MGCVCAVWMDALKKCTVEDKMRARGGRSDEWSVGRRARAVGRAYCGRRGWVEACVAPGYVM